VVIDRVTQFYVEENANVHRGVHWLSERATEAFEEARATIRWFLNARRAEEIVFVRGTTEAINLVAQTYGRSRVARGDEIIISTMEHHSNIVPWQILCEQQGARLRIIPITDAGELDLDAYATLLTNRTRIVSVVHVSNVLGTVNPVQEIVRIAHQHGIPVLVDGAQAVAHGAVDVQALGCDFYVFSGHKMFGPTGIGVLWGKRELLDKMPPYQGGGDMIESVTFEKTTYAQLPNKFEAGTPDVSAAIGLGAALDYLSGLGMEHVRAHERELVEYALEVLPERVKTIRIHGTKSASERAGVITFNLADAHPHDVATLLDREAIAIRAGHHCTMPLHQRMGEEASARASFYVYTGRDDIDRLAEALNKVERLFARN